MLAANRITSDLLVSETSTPPSGETDVLIRSVPLGGSPFSRALQEGRIGAEWIAARPLVPAEWRQHAERVRASHRGADWLAALAPAIAATGPAAERLGRAAAAGVVVTTGQQPGLFGGPAYTFSKAVGALAMADVLEAEIGMPVAPVFWAASDDADWMEAAVTHVVTARGLEKLSLAGPATEGIAMADVPLGDVSAELERVRAAAGSLVHSDVLELVAAAYVPQSTIGGAYLQLLRALLEPLGIAVLDAAHPACRNAADGFLRHALGRAAAISENLALRTTAIRALGYEPQVDPIDDLSLVFRSQLGVSGRERDRVRERIPLKEASRTIRESDTGTLGANVLLRPVLESVLLPTVSYMAGPGEYAYFAQVSAVADALGVPSPVVAPRWSCELIDHRAFTLLRELSIEEVTLHQPHAAETELARRSVAEPVQDALERLRVATDTQLRAVREAIAHDDAVVAPEVVAGLDRDIGHRLERFERRVRAGVKRRESELLHRVAMARAWLRPNGMSPERVHSIVPLLARYGSALLSRMHAEAMPHARALVQGDSRTR